MGGVQNGFVSLKCERDEVTSCVTAILLRNRKRFLNHKTARVLTPALRCVALNLGPLVVFLNTTTVKQSGIFGRRGLWR